MVLNGKVALVTGGAERAGRVFSLALAKAGADIIINHWRTPDAAEETKAEIEKLNRRCLVIEGDVANLNDINKMINNIDENFGRLDILLHNASNFNNVPFMKVSEEIWDSSINLNLKGPFFLSQAAAKLMLKNGSGRIIGMSGNSSFECWPDFVPHAIAKSGLVRLMQLLAVTLSPNIQCSAICPSTFLPADQGQYAPVMKERGEIFVDGNKNIRMRGLKIHNGCPEEVGELVVFLAGCSDYLNGVVIPIDGGKHLI